MTKEIESSLIFEGYSIGNMEYKRNYNFDKDKEVNLNFNFGANAKFTEEKDEALLSINCKIFEEEFEKQEAPFYLDITIDGNFKCEGDVDIETFQLNGMAILLPHLRATVTSFTSQSGIPPVLIPPINVYNAFEKIESNDSR